MLHVLKFSELQLLQMSNLTLMQCDRSYTSYCHAVMGLLSSSPSLSQPRVHYGVGSAGSTPY